MVTRRAVLKGTAAASIGAIAAAHGAAPAEAASFDVGYGQLTGGAVGGFYKYSDAFQIALKFQKWSAEVFFKEELSGVAVFFKYFDKQWTNVVSEPLDSTKFPDLQTSVISFSKIHTRGAELFLESGSNYLTGEIGMSTDGAFLKITPGSTD